MTYQMQLPVIVATWAYGVLLTDFDLQHLTCPPPTSTIQSGPPHPHTHTSPMFSIPLAPYTLTTSSILVAMGCTPAIRGSKVTCWQRPRGEPVVAKTLLRYGPDNLPQGRYEEGGGEGNVRQVNPKEGEWQVVLNMTISI